MATKPNPLIPVLDTVDLREAHLYGTSGSPYPYYNQLVRVVGSTNSGSAELFGVLTGVTYNKDQDTKVFQIIVYMEGQQHTAFNTKTGCWIYPVSA